MPLSTVQVKFVNEAARPTIEQLIAMRYTLDAFVLDFDNQQDPIPTDATVLDDDSSGTSPRTGAPELTGANVQSLRNFAANMRDQINGPALNALVALAVRPVSTIIRG